MKFREDVAANWAGFYLGVSLVGFGERQRYGCEGWGEMG
jgi:hypothetical protein